MERSWKLLKKLWQFKMKDELAINVVRTNGADHVAQGKGQLISENLVICS